MVLPLAMLGCFTLLLGSLSVQTAALEARLEQGASRRQRQAEDLLASAAQQLVGDLGGHYPCLLSLPLEQWSAAPADCAPAATLSRLQAGQVFGEGYRLLAWQPQAGEAAAELLLELTPNAQVPAGPRRAAFRVALAAEATGVRVVDLRELGLRGVSP